MKKKQNSKRKDWLLELKNRFIRFKKLKGRELKEIEKLFLKPINISIEDMDKFEEK